MFMLSIVVPVFGVEKFILDFAESLLPQLNEKVQLIVVNDGTKDNSIVLLKNYINKINYKYNNIIFLEQNNQGQSVARNYGISMSQGTYVTFLDPDDRVGNTYIAKICENIENFNPDVIHFNLAVFLNDTGKKINTLCIADNNNLIFNSYENNLKMFKKALWFSVMRVVKKDFLNNQFFPVGVIYEDMIAFPEIYKNVNTIKNINEELVYYRIHLGSSTQGFQPKQIVSSEYGMKFFEGLDDNLDKVIYDSFLKLRLTLGLENIGFIKTLKWFRVNMISNENSIHYLNYFLLLKLVMKIKLVFFAKKILRR